MLDEENLELLEKGLELFGEGEFFEAHEYFETLWQQADEEEDQQEFLFLVRLAAGAVHLTNSNFSSLFMFQLAYKQLREEIELNHIAQQDKILEDLSNLIKKLENSKRESLVEISKDIKLGLKLK